MLPYPKNIRRTVDFYTGRKQPPFLINSTEKTKAKVAEWQPQAVVPKPPEHSGH